MNLHPVKIWKMYLRTIKWDDKIYIYINAITDKKLYTMNISTKKSEYYK